MENLRSHKTISGLSILFLFHLLSLFAPSTSYELPDLYFINCGSSSTLTVYGRSFVGDENHPNYVLSSGDSKRAEDSTLAEELYQTARIFRKSSSYELDLDQNGTYIVRFHFFPFPSVGNLSDARFSVFASQLLLLLDFRVGNGRFPLIEEFLLEARQGKFSINFVPEKGQSFFAFVNAIEVILAPPHLKPSVPPLHVTPQGPDVPYNGVLDGTLKVVHRINVGGPNVTPHNDSMLRSWVPDDGYLLHRETARNSDTYGGSIIYQDGKATKFDAPDSVYRTAKEMATSPESYNPNNFNVSWNFNVRKGAQHYVRMHFCDIVSHTSNEQFYFNLYLYTNYVKEMWPYGEHADPAAPFYIDYVVYSDNDSGFLNISIGPNDKSGNKNAFLNGVEIMEMIEGASPPKNSGSPRKRLLIIVGSSAGGVILVLIIMFLFLFSVAKRKWRTVEAIDWPLVPLHGGSSHSRTTVRTSTGSLFADLNLGLKLAFSEVLVATKNFDAKLILGEGGFGKVYEGKLRNGTKVAVKRSEPGHGQGLQEFHTEIMVLSKIRYHHLVSLIGYCDERDEMILVYEFMENGTLRDHLYSSQEEANWRASGPPFSWDQRLQICIGAAKGLHYLHTGSTGTIIHRDIKSTNILLDENYVAKVADFGLSRLGHLDQTHVSTEVKGSFGYLDPEYFKCLQLTLKSDVYSFGVVLLEVLCAMPVIDFAREQVNLADWGMAWQRKGQLERIIDPFLQGKVNPNSLRKFGETVEKCLQECGADRPNMVDVLWDLEYCLQLQQIAIPKQPYEDSTTEVSMGLPMNVVLRLPSNTNAIGEEDDELPVTDDSFSNASQLNGSEVFSLLKYDEAR